MKQYESYMEELVASLINEEPALGRYKETLLARCKPSLSIEIKPNDQLPIGCSKFGGKPDLPPDFSYPTLAEDYSPTVPRGTPLTFLVQYRLEDFEPFPFARAVLPPDGMLYFFGVCVERDIWTEPDTGRVIYWRGDVTTLQPYDGKEKDLYTYQQADLSFRPSLTLPPRLDLHDDEVDPDDGEGELSAYSHQLLGFPRPFQHLWKDEETLQDFVLLLQLDTLSSKLEPGPSFGDAGSIYYLAPTNDMRDRLFENIWFEGACC